MENAWSKTLTRMRLLFDRQHGATPDADLLRRYVGHGDRAAFELLVWRHGLMVYNVCRHSIKCPHAADDAFQAVFLILARKARSIRNGAALAGWLHRVTLRVVHEAQRQAERQRSQVDVAVADPPDPNPSSPEQRETQRLVNEELDRLPGRYRLPLLLCYLEGKSNAEAAVELGVPVGTIFSRLARGRERLRRRLERRGIALGTAALGCAFPSADAALASLIPQTVSAGMAFVARAAPATAITASSLSLAKGVLHTMWLKTCTITCGLVLAVGVVGLTSWQWLLPSPAQDAVAKPAQPQVSPNESPLTDLLKKKVDSAKRAFEEHWKMVAIGKSAYNLGIYQRSRTWLEAERELRPNQVLPALEAHRERVKQVFDSAKARFDAGNMPPGEFFDCEYALLEADVWILREKEKR